MHAEINAIHGWGRADSVEEFRGDAPPRLIRQCAAGGDEKGTVGRNQFDPRHGIEHAQRPANLIAHGAVIIHQLSTPPNAEVTVAAEVRIERGYLLFAFSDKNSGHGRNG